MEIKVLCACGAKFKFDVEPVNGRSPGPVRCPACGQDRTEETNSLIGEQLAASAATAPTASPSGPQVAIPAIRIPAAPAPSAPMQVSSAAPAAAVGPKPVMPVPESTKSLSVKPPGEAAVHAEPSPSAPTQAATPAPGSPKMAFMPAPAAGSGASLSVAGAAKHDQPMQVGSATPPPPPPPSHVHPATARMMPSAAPLPPEGKFGMGVTGAIIGCLLGAAIWYFLALNVMSGRRIAILALIPGVVGGVGAVLLARKPSQRLGVAAAIVAACVTIPTQFAVIAGLNDKYLTQASEQSFTQTMAIAKKAANAKTDAQVLEIMDEDPQIVGLDDPDARGIRAAVGRALEKAVKEARQKSAQEGKLDEDDKAELDEYRKKRLPELIKFAKGEPSRTKFIEKERERLKEEDDVTYEPSWIWIGIISISSVRTAYFFGRGKKK